MTTPFRNIQLEDRIIIEKFFGQKKMTTKSVDFTVFFCWKNSHQVSLCSVDGIPLIRYSFYGKQLFYCMAPGYVEKLLPVALNDARENGVDFVSDYVDTRDFVAIRRLLPHYGIYSSRDFSDYIYLREKLKRLDGKPLQSKRNLASRFMHQHSFQYLPLSENDKEECLSLFAKWKEQKFISCNITDSSEFHAEEDCIRMGLTYFDSLGLIGGKLCIDGRMVAFSFGTALSDNMFDVMIEKTDENYKGAFQAINQQIALHLPENFMYVNREEDMGIHGLRIAKLSYHPLMFNNLYVLKKMSPLMLQIKNLWLKCFPSDSEMDAEQFLFTRFSADRMLARYDGGQLVAMVHLIPFADVLYFYALAIHPDYRHHGLGHSLMEELLQIGKLKGFKMLAGVPGDEIADNWYSALGYHERHVIKFNTRDGYDFGKCDGTPDMAVIIPLNQMVSISQESPLILSE